MKHLKFLMLMAMAAILSCAKSDKVLLPTVTTAEISGVANTTAGAGGMVTDDGGNAVTARGVVWSTTENPTIANDKTTDGSGTGSFTSNITGLTANTTYYLRAYATNSAGTAYGNQVSFTTTNVPAPGTTIEYIVDIETVLGSRINNSNSSVICYEATHAEFDMDPFAVSYTVHFYDMLRDDVPFADKTYSFAADIGIEIIKAGTNDGNYTYVTDHYSIGNLGAVTRDTQANNLYCNVGWCSGQGVCNGPCARITGKAKITVHY